MKRVLFFICIGILFPTFVFASQSKNSNYWVKKMELAQQVSVEVVNILAGIQWAVPELRVGAPETNDDANFYISVYSSAEDGLPPIFQMTQLKKLTNEGKYPAVIQLQGVVAGVYDVIIKTDQHLSKKLNDISIANGINLFNFSTLNNSTTKGSEVLLAGDVSNQGTDPSNLGDNVVNSVDVSILLDNLNTTDSTGNSIRANVNQDTQLNSVDLSIFLKNLDKVGEGS